MRRRDLAMVPVSVALAAAAGLFVLRYNPGGILRPCPLRLLIGIPCPTCGGTAASRAIVGGDLGDAFRANPLVAATILVALAAAVLALVALPWARRVRIPPLVGRRPFVVALVIAVLANWLYLILSTR